MSAIVETLPRIPILPTLSAGLQISVGQALSHSLLGVGRPLIVDRGATAIRLALEHAGIGPGDEVLMPAFHCPSMVRPVEQIGATPRYYRVRPSLDFDLDQMTELRSRRTRAVLAVHFFGQRQDMRLLRAFADEKGLVLIEDCAHAFFGTRDGVTVGATGDYAIGSPRKFFPVVEGGLLTSSRHDLTIVASRCSPPRNALRVGYDTIDFAVQHGRLTGLAASLRVARSLARRRTSRARPATEVVPTDSAVGCQGRRVHWSTRAALRTVSHAWVVEMRSRNFKWLSTALGELPGLSLPPLELLRDGGPYMVPVILGQPTDQFPMLKSLQVPMWRWEHSVRGVCPVTDHYAQALIQLPCHQDLRQEEMERIVAAFRQVHRSRLT